MSISKILISIIYLRIVGETIILRLEDIASICNISISMGNNFQTERERNEVLIPQLFQDILSLS